MYTYGFSFSYMQMWTKRNDDLKSRMDLGMCDGDESMLKVLFPVVGNYSGSRSLALTLFKASIIIIFFNVPVLLLTRG